MELKEPPALIVDQGDPLPEFETPKNRRARRKREREVRRLARKNARASARREGGAKCS